MSFSYNKNIFINGDVLSNALGFGNRGAIADYDVGMRSVFSILSKSDTGKILLDAVSNTGKYLLIKPYVPMATEISACDALSAQIPGSRGSLLQFLAYTNPSFQEDATPKGEPVLLNDGKPSKSLLGNELVGTGDGVNSTIHFSPDMWGAGAICSPGKPGATAHAVLFHELVHSYRHMKGRRNSQASTNGLKTYDNDEEYLAIIVTNIFIADPTTPSVGSRTLRFGHRGFKPMTAKESTTLGFMANAENVKMIKKLENQEPELTKALANVDCFFNPFREVIYDAPAGRLDQVSRTA